jgi:hypothetical protein
MLQLNLPNGSHQLPFLFSSSNLSVTCTPVCGVGDTFSMNLSMSKFTQGLGLPFSTPWTGSLDFVGQSTKLTADSGVALIRFILTGQVSGCASQFSQLCFTIDPNFRGYARVRYKIVGGEMEITNASYSVPEPTSAILLGTGIIGTWLLRRRQSKRAAASHFPL